MNTIEKQISKENIKKINNQIAIYFAQTHQIKGLYFGYPTKDKDKQFKTWDKAFNQMFQMILDDAKDRQIRLPFKRIAYELQKHQGVLAKIKEPHLINYDCWSGNIFLSKDKEEYYISELVDFERAFYGDPVADFAPTFLFSNDFRKEKEFLKTYFKHNPYKKDFTMEDYIRFQLYRLYLCVIMITETYRYPKAYALAQRSFSKMIMRKCLTELKKL